jgi:NAD(P)-dependent dehydrogenase (short-subunit alcohol dehydrogenase family)
VGGPAVTDPSTVPDYLSLLRFDGTGVVIFGAGQGIGRQASHAFAQAGARCLCVDLDRDLATAVAAEVDGVPLVGDATTRADAERLFAEAAAQPGGFGAVVDIIGMARFKMLTDMDDADLSWQYDIVLGHAILALQVAGPLLAARGGGAFTFVSSASGGPTGSANHAVYGAMKAGLISLVRSMAVEYGPAGVRVNSVAPGAVRTPRVAGMLGEAGVQRNAEATPLGRMALPSDIAGALLFLTSNLASYVTGQTLLVDGGVGSKFPYPPPPT